MAICQSTKVAPTDQQLLMLASSIASRWVSNVLDLLNECNQADETQKRNTLSLMCEFAHLERYVRAHLMPDVDSKKQEQFIFSLEHHWICELQQLADQWRMKLGCMAPNCLN